jgi:hypothetical protein
MSNLFNGQAVKVTASHNHINACAKTQYSVGAINRVQGQYMVNLLLNGKSVGAVPEAKLSVK